MMKKVLIVAGGVVLVLFLLLGKEMVTHVKTGVSGVQEWVDGHQSPEYRLKHSKEQLKELHDDILDEKKEAAQLENSRDRVAQSVAKLQKEMDVEEREMLVLNNALQTGENEFEFGGEYFTSTEVKDDLEARLKGYESLEETLASRKNELGTLNSTLDKKLEGIRELEDNAREFESKIRELEARIASLRAKEQASKDARVSSSNSAELEENLSKAEVDISSEEKMLDSFERPGRIPVSEPNEAEDIVSRINNKFSPGETSYAASEE